MLLPRLAFAALLAFTPPAMAETAVEQPAAVVSIAKLGEVLQLDELFEVLRDEGLDYGKTMETDMFPSGGGAGWEATVSAIYDVRLLRARFNAALRAELASDPATMQSIMDFLASDLGQRVVGLEIEARRAFLDTATEEAARVAADDRAANRDPKVALVRRFVEAGDLLEMNVAGALSGNLAYMKGMAETGAYGRAMPEDQIMSDVWAQEAQIREDTSSWLYAFLGLAYDPLTEAELQAYIDFMESPAGQRLNAALFVAYDKVFRKVSYDLGRAAGIAMQGRDI
ncbi:hypothetical protein [Tabrizicola sp.]|uniref:hypothetical protein n=1 Tax=Tabrizicola sp. TaxID=2005166 RepID=UPI003F3715CA